MIPMNLPKITIIVAVFNGAATLQRCLKRIASQSYDNKELIVMDGGSTDESIKILEDNAQVITYWESRTDRGIYHAWNKALSHATGDWIIFLGSDDFFWKEDVLEKMVPSLLTAEASNIRLVYGKIAFIDKMGDVQNVLGMQWKKKRSISSDQIPPHPGLLHHANIFRDHGRFDETFRIVGDYELLLRELKTREAMFVPEIIVAGVQSGGVSCNIRNLLQIMNEDISARRKHGLDLITTRALRYYAGLLYNSIFH